MIVEKQQQSIDQLKLDKCSDVDLPHISENGCGEINHSNASEEIPKKVGKKHKASESDNTSCGVSLAAKRTRGD